MPACQSRFLFQDEDRKAEDRGTHPAKTAQGGAPTFGWSRSRESQGWATRPVENMSFDSKADCERAAAEAELEAAQAWAQAAEHSQRQRH